MKLRLTLRSCPPAQGTDTQRHLAAGQLVIGRSPEADWFLRDQEKVLSKRHCVVEFKGGVYIVIDTSTNGVFHNESDKPLGRGNSVVLGDGDRLRFGAFMIKVDFVEDQPVVAPAADPFLAVLRETDTRNVAADPIPDDDDPFAAPGGAGAVAWTRIPDDVDDGDEGPLLPPRPALDPFAAEAEWQRRAPDWEPTTDAENDGGLETAAWRSPEVAGAAIPDDWDDGSGRGAPFAPMEPVGDPFADPFAADPFVEPVSAGGPALSAAGAVGAVDGGIPDDWLDEGRDGDEPGDSSASDGPPAFSFDVAPIRSVSAGGEPPVAGTSSPLAWDEADVIDSPDGDGGDGGEMSRLADQAARAARALGAPWPPPGVHGDGEAVARHMSALLGAARAALTEAGVAVDQFEAAYRRELSDSAEW